VDSALFSLYFIYRTDVQIAAEFDSAPSSSPYSTLVEVFRTVETDGWDAARIRWILYLNILRPTDKQPISLFGSVDERVFSFIKDAQLYSRQTTCERVDCPRRQRNFTSTELDLL